jgi:diguanylate cyclase
MLLISNTKRFILFFTLILTALILSTVAFAKQFTSVVEDQAAEEHTIQVLAQGHRLMEDLEMAETGQRGYLLTNKDDYLTPYFKGVDDASDAVNKLRSAVSDDKQSVEMVDQIARNKDLKLIELERTIILSRDGKQQEAVSVVQTDVGQNYMSDLRADIQALMNTWRNYRAKAVEDERKRTLFSIIALMFIGFAIVAVLVWSIWTQSNAYDEMKAHVEHLDHQATRDPLTDLYNRRKLLADIDMLSETHAHPVGLIYIDIDGFKAVNDSMGHDAGDRLLKKLAKSFNSITRETDTLARIGGDEFVFLIPNYQDDKQLIEISKRIIRNVEALSKSDYRSMINASVGIATYSSRVQSIHDLLGAADGAMYKSKRSGRGHYHFSEKL